MKLRREAKKVKNAADMVESCVLPQPLSAAPISRADPLYPTPSRFAEGAFVVQAKNARFPTILDTV